jgi:hypothetical protein
MLTFTEISLFRLILKHWYQYQYDMIPINDILVHINYRCVEKGKDVGQRSNMENKNFTKETFQLHPKNLTNQMSQAV